MSINDQHLVDHLYNAVYIQTTRCNYFSSCSNQQKSIWNKHTDEKQILEIYINNYKNFYRNKIETLKTTLETIKNKSINSYLTYDKDFYINEYNNHVQEINTYLSKLDLISSNNILSAELTLISPRIDSLFPNYLAIPTLFGQLP